MIGIYDSGLGGLTVLRHVRRLLPNADILYFGDTEHLPYGTRSPDLIRRYAEGAMRFFLSEGISALLVACGTVSTVALDAISGAVPFPTVGITLPSVAAAAASGARRIAVLGTSATVGSGAYERLLCHAIAGVTVLSVPCPLFVSLVENGITDRSDPALRLLVARYLAPCFSFRPDTVMLGCTHFPVLSEVIGDLLPHARLIDCGLAAARTFASLALNVGESATRYCVSDNPDRFRLAAAHIYPIAANAVIETVKTDRA